MKPFALTNFTKAMLYFSGREPSIIFIRRILIEHILFYTRHDAKLSETNIYVEIEKIWKMPEDKLIRKFNRARNAGQSLTI
jgi:hypothetical protein